MSNLNRHVKVCRGRKILVCPYCAEQFTNHRDEINHINSTHKPKNSWQFRKVFEGVDKFEDFSHITSENEINDIKDRQYVTKEEGAIKSIFKYFKKQTFLHEALGRKELSQVKELLVHLYSKDDNLTLNGHADTIISKVDVDGCKIHDTGYLSTRAFRITCLKDIDHALLSFQDDLLLNAINFEKKGSGWSISHIRFLEFIVCRGQPIRGGGGSEDLALIDDRVGVEILGAYNGKGIRYIEDDDGECLMSAIIYGLHAGEVKRKFIGQVLFNEYVQNGDKLKNEFKANYDWSGMRFPSALSDLKRFETNNPELNVIFHVYSHNHSFSEKYRTPVQNVPNPLAAVHVNLVLAPYERASDLTIKHHWFVVDDFSKFMDKRYTKTSTGQGNASISGAISCNNCGKRYGKKNATKLAIHQLECITAPVTQIKMPEQGSCVMFNKPTNIYRQRFNMYFDVETLHCKMSRCCMECNFLISKTHCPKEKRKIARKCKKKGHHVVSNVDCKHCAILKMSLIRDIHNKCNTKNSKYQCKKIIDGNDVCEVCDKECGKILEKNTCSPDCGISGVCEDGCSKRDRCEHSYEQQKARLDAAM